MQRKLLSVKIVSIVPWENVTSTFFNWLNHIFPLLILAYDWHFIYSFLAWFPVASGISSHIIYLLQFGRNAFKHFSYFNNINFSLDMVTYVVQSLNNSKMMVFNRLIPYLDLDSWIKYCYWNLLITSDLVYLVFLKFFFF